VLAEDSMLNSALVHVVDGRGLRELLLEFYHLLLNFSLYVCYFLLMITRMRTLSRIGEERVKELQEAWDKPQSE
jgi:hypothetical protein